MNNIMLKTDSYKLNHWNQYPPGTEAVYSYFESRKGAKYPETVFFSLQYIVDKYLAGVVVTKEKIEQAKALAKAHFGGEGFFNEEGWNYILEKHNGKLPLEIRAVSEGTAIPTGNVLMTVVNTDRKCFWLTNYVESVLTHIWYGSTVATISREVKKMIKKFLDKTSDNPLHLNFSLHDFGYRGTSSDESAEVGGSAHLLNFLGTDTVPAMQFLVDYYGANKDYSDIGYSISATEHSIMTSLGEAGEECVLTNLFTRYPSGLLSIVADSYDYYNFITEFMCKKFKNNILYRNGKVVIRPDSVTDTHATPEYLVLWTLKELEKYFEVSLNSKGYKVLPPNIGLIWGDGIDPDGISKILERITLEGWSADNIVFGMGGGLLQKLNRDTQRFAFKCSAQMRDGVWFDVQKNPLDQSKKSKAGRLKLIKVNGEFKTVKFEDDGEDLLQLVLKDGIVYNKTTLEDMRKRCNA